MENLSPSQQNKKWAAINFDGSLAIVTIVSGAYQWYLPLWFYCIKKELPAAHPIAYIHGDVEGLPFGIIGADMAMDIRASMDLNVYPVNGPTTAALRFTYDDQHLRSFDYVLITDCDILMVRENPSIINQHMRMAGRYNLGCYHNYISNDTPEGAKVPGVHFVTRAWWDATAATRAKYQKLLREYGSTDWDWDEHMLYRIILESGLTPPPREYHIWAHHGIHLGDYRRRIDNKTKGPVPSGHHSSYLRQLQHDPEFMHLVDLCAPHLKHLKETFKLLNQLVG